jgi:hypothetical protein
LHTIRLVVEGELAGLFDGESTVTFDAGAPMMVIDTSGLKGASPETKALLRLATSNWIRRSTTGSHRQPRVVVHEEAAIELLNDVAGGSGGGLTEKVAGEKVARHDGVSNWYLMHRIADLDALGDRGSAIHSQALGLLADYDTRISYAQHDGELGRSQEIQPLPQPIESQRDRAQWDAMDATSLARTTAKTKRPQRTPTAAPSRSHP